ncbi:rhomboid-like protein [Raineyella sp.]|uniref:rhomboid-like protein n=1 Tax=Raineyella sp. TaxID=1911550 RepID=UPI002B1EA563|nr:rhomboid-like protein [Raineyella sp.]MEA5153413.1 rhomboid-like protein [Raineyella sp.]
MVTLVVALAIGLVTFASARDWPGTRRLHALWLHHGPAIIGYVCSAPATFVTLAVLGVTTWILAGAGSRVSLALLRDMSTNLHQLRQEPMTVLVRSAFWATPVEMVGWLVLFTLIAAPIERWIGTRAWLLVFWVGHIGATLLVAVLLTVGVSSGRVPTTVANTIDVGASYAFFCLAAVGTYGLRGRWRIAWAALIVAYVAQAAFTSPGFTSLGHTVAALIGFAIGPVFLRRPAATGWPVAGLEALGARAAGRLTARRRRSATARPVPDPQPVSGPVTPPRSVASTASMMATSAPTVASAVPREVPGVSLPSRGVRVGAGAGPRPEG